MAGVLPLTK